MGDAVDDNAAVAVDFEYDGERGFFYCRDAFFAGQIHCFSGALGELRCEGEEDDEQQDHVDHRSEIERGFTGVFCSCDDHWETFWRDGDAEVAGNFDSIHHGGHGEHGEKSWNVTTLILRELDFIAGEKWILL